MDDEVVKRKHKQKMSTPEKRKQDSENIIKYNSSELRKLHDKETSERQRGIYNSHFKQYNDSRKQPIAMIDEDGNIIMKFESCADACRYIEETEHRKIDKSYTATFKRYSDKFNKNGKRAKFLGHSWKLL